MGNTNYFIPKYYKKKKIKKLKTICYIFHGKPNRIRKVYIFLLSYFLNYFYLVWYGFKRYHSKIRKINFYIFTFTSKTILCLQSRFHVFIKQHDVKIVTCLRLQYLFFAFWRSNKRNTLRAAWRLSQHHRNPSQRLTTGDWDKKTEKMISCCLPLSRVAFC